MIRRTHSIRTEVKRKSDAGIGLIKLGLDVHLSFIMCVEQRGGRPSKAGYKLGREELLLKVMRWVKDGYEVHAVYEACGLGFSLCRDLKAEGAHAYVISPVCLQEDGSRRKTDRADAQALCHRLARYLDGERNALPVIRIPSPEEEKRRAVARRREALLEQRRLMESQGRALCAQHCGHSLPSRWWGPRNWKKLSAYLDPWLAQMLEKIREVLIVIQEQDRELEEQIKGTVKGQVYAKGFGELTLAQCTAEVCDWHRFNNRKQVGSYTGCCPGEHSSGGKRRQGGIDRRGNARLRSMLVEAAWRLVQWNPGYFRIKQRADVLLDKKAPKRLRRIAIVAVARGLAVDLWRLQTGRCRFEDLGLIAA